MQFMYSPYVAKMFVSRLQPVGLGVIRLFGPANCESTRVQPPVIQRFYRLPCSLTIIVYKRLPYNVAFSQLFWLPSVRIHFTETIVQPIHYPCYTSHHAPSYRPTCSHRLCLGPAQRVLSQWQIVGWPRV